MIWSLLHFFIAPTFEVNPRGLKNTSTVAGKSLTLCLCHLQAPSLLPEEGEIYISKEGSSTKLPIKVNFGPFPRNFFETCSSMSRYFAYVFQQVGFENQGRYQCVYQPKGISEPIFSRKIFMTVKGTSLYLFKKQTILS